MRNVLITGASGFLGQRATDSILTQTNLNLILLHRDSTDLSFLEKHQSQRISKVNIQDSKFIKNLHNNYFDCVIHIATNYGRKNPNLKEIIYCNLILPLEILQSRNSSGISHFINIDSYFNKFGNRYDQLFDYSNSKKSLQLWLKHESENIKVSNLLLEHMYGPGDTKDKFVPRLINHVKNDFKTDLKLSPGGQVRDFIYVDDVANAIVEVLTHPSPRNYEELQIGTGFGHTIKEIGQIICNSLNKENKINFGEGWYRKSEIMSSIADLSTMKEYNWVPNVDLETGINWILSND